MIPDLALPGCAPDCACLVLDSRARICQSLQGEAIGYSADELLHQPIRRVIPGLPLTTITPCYNVAFVRFWFGETAWRRYLCTSPHGRSLAVDLNMRLIARDGRHFLLAWARPLAVGRPRETEVVRTLPAKVGFRLTDMGAIAGNNTVSRSCPPRPMELARHDNT
jgi:hypothetical protein